MESLNFNQHSGGCHFATKLIDPRNQLIIHNFDFSVEDQPLEVIKRVKALKKLQFENIKHEVSNN